MWQLAAFTRLTRPLFLVGGALAYGLGASLAQAQGATIDPARYLLGQALVTSVQLAAQYVNEFFDAPGDRATERTWFSGGSGVLPAGLLPPRAALVAALTASLAAAALMAVVALTDLPAAVLGALALAGSWAYSAPPLRLVGSGFGEVTASIIVGALVPLAGLWINGGHADAEYAWIGATLVGAHFAMIVALSMPDRAVDADSGKRTLAVRVGFPRVRLWHAGAVVVGAVALTAAAATGVVPASTALFSLVAAPPAAVQLAAMRYGERAHLLTASAVATFAALTAALLAGTLLS